MSQSSLIEGIVAAIKNHTVLPSMPADLSLEEGYAIQKQVVAAVSSTEPAGWKAGMTAAAGQKAFGLTHPLIGFLYAEGRMETGCQLSAVDGLKLECEIGIVVDGNGKPKSAGPVIEVPCMAWGSPEDAKGTNLTATNIAADRYIVGTQSDFRDDYDSLSVKLTRDGELVCEAPLTDALGGPSQALEWMLEEAKQRDMTLSDGMLLITGACGGIQDALPGTYLADYGVLGQIPFTVQ